MYSDANKNLPSLIFASSYGYIQMYVCDGGRVARFEADRSNKRTRKLYSSLDLVHNNGAYIQF